MTTLFGGSFVTVRPGDLPFRANPFAIDPTAANLEFLFGFCKLLLEVDGKHLADDESKELFEAIKSLYVLEPSLRRLKTLSTTLPRALGKRLDKWIEGGQYGIYFDHSEDTLTLDRFQCIDFEQMEEIGQALEPLMLYLLHHINQLVCDPALATTFKLIVIDEAWRFLKHSITRDYIVTALKTARKKNAAIVLATQSLEDLADLQAFRTIVENCPTKLLLANPDLDPKFYADVLGLSATEQERVKHLVPKRQFLLKRDTLSKVLNLNLDRRSYWLLTTDPYESARRQKLVDEHGLSAALDILTGGEK